MLDFFHKLGTGTVTCDQCSNSDDFDGEDFREFITNAKESGWVMRPDKDKTGDWDHICPDCIEREQSGDDLEDSI